ncbi:FecR family protein [Algivirga pacifica]|uniref:FecR domain-containing protein n=1 Tax=Algivirga pacifica TaxID=1162670 RepID=A0ABP9CXS6_9BACT
MEIDQLIIRYLTKETNAVEEEFLHSWRQEAEENERYFQQYQRTWEWSLLQQQQTEVQFDRNSAWQKITDRTQLPSDTKKTVRWQPIVWQVAAAVTLLLGSIWLFQLVQEETNAPLQQLTASETQAIELGDKSLITLDKGATFQYPEEFAKHQRTVTLQKGQAFFEISHDPDRPFIVNLPNTQIQVVGTAFNIKIDSLGTEVAVREGKVIFKHKEQVTSPVTLTKGDIATYTIKEETFTTTQTVGNQWSWKSKQFNFTDTPLPVVLEQLEMAYDVHFEIGEQDLLNCRLSMFNQRAYALEEMIEFLELSLGIEIHQQDSSHFKVLGTCN